MAGRKAKLLAIVRRLVFFAVLARGLRLVLARALVEAAAFFRAGFGFGGDRPMPARSAISSKLSRRHCE